MEWISEQLKIGILLNKQIVMFGMINGEINQLYAANWLIINIKYHILGKNIILILLKSHSNINFI